MMIDVAQQQMRTPATTATVEILDEEGEDEQNNHGNNNEAAESVSTAEIDLEEESLSIQSMEEGTQEVVRNNASQTTSYTFRLN